jgi:hypothetical protein
LALGRIRRTEEFSSSCTIESGVLGVDVAGNPGSNSHYLMKIGGRVYFLLRMRSTTTTMI